jgi:predicted dehydrogenase
MIKVGLLGLGFVGKIHLTQGYLKFDKSEISLEACFDVAEDNLALVDCPRKYKDLDSFFENECGKLDIIDICLPTFLHAEIAIKAMKQGFHVICEKPMALSIQDAEKMYKTSVETGKKLMIAHVLRFDEDYMQIKEYIDSEILGKPVHAKYTTFRAGVPGGWFQNSNLSGGPIIDVHIHDADILTWFFGMPKSLSTIAPKKSDAGCYDSFSTNMEYDKLIVNVECDFSLPKILHDNNRSLRIIFENGYIVKNEEIFVAVDKDGNLTDLKTKRSAYYHSDAMYYNEIKYFADSIKTGSEIPKCSPYDSCLSAKLVQS